MVAEAVKYSCSGEMFEIELVDGRRGKPHYWGNRSVHEEEVEAAIYGMAPNGELQLLSVRAERDTYDTPRARILQSKDDTAVLFIAIQPEEAKILSGVVERLCDIDVLVQQTGEVYPPDSSSMVGAKYQRTDKKAPLVIRWLAATAPARSWRSGLEPTGTSRSVGQECRHDAPARHLHVSLVLVR